MTNLKKMRLPLIIVTVATASLLILSSWDFKNSNAIWNDEFCDQTDTLPKKENREKKIRDLDDVLDELNNVDIKVDMEKMQKELSESLKKLDAKKIQLDMEKTLKDIDFEKIQKEIKESMAKIDWEKMKSDFNESMNKIEWDKMKAELSKVREVDMKNFQQEMDKMQKELSKIGPEIEKSLEKAKVEIEKAKDEIKEYKEFVDGLEKDGLLKKSEAYTLKHKDRELLINGKKASDATYSKYKKFLEKHKEFNIKKTDDDFDLDID
jgi:hypothetical protein